MKKKLMMALSLVLVAVMSIGGTLAYLTAQDEVTNTFTVGNVALKLDEAKVDPDTGKEITGDDAERVKANEYKIYPAAVLDKDPTVTVLADSEPCYVRMLVTVNNLSALDAIFAPTGASLRTIFTGTNANWEYAGETEKDDTITYEFRYKNIVPAAETDTELPALFTQVVIPDEITGAQLQTLENFEINVVAHAIQAAGFGGNVDTAWTSFKAPVSATP